MVFFESMSPWGFWDCHQKKPAISSPVLTAARGSKECITGSHRNLLFDKFGMHAPLNRQSARFKAEGIDLPLSTLADQVGHGTFALKPVFDLIENHVLAAERLHGDDTTVPILAKAKCATGRIWTYLWTAPASQGIFASFRQIVVAAIYPALWRRCHGP